MDLTKLLSMLESRSLHFTRADKFDDPYEGMQSKAGAAYLRTESQKGGQITPEMAEAFLQGTIHQIRSLYVNCWYASEHESAAMWKLYLQSNEGIAIRSDFETLATVLDASNFSIRATQVKYIDYDTVPIPFDNGFNHITHKRLSFAHEQELRAVIWSWEGVNSTQIAKEADFVKVDIEPAELVKSVHVSPTAPKWFGELVEQIMKRYALNVPVERSNLYTRPTY